MKFTFEETTLIEAYDIQDRRTLIDEIQKSLELVEDEEMWELMGNLLSKLRLMSDEEFRIF